MLPLQGCWATGCLKARSCYIGKPSKLIQFWSGIAMKYWLHGALSFSLLCFLMNTDYFTWRKTSTCPFAPTWVNQTSEWSTEKVKEPWRVASHSYVLAYCIPWEAAGGEFSCGERTWWWGPLALHFWRPGWWSWVKKLDDLILKSLWVTLTRSQPPLGSWAASAQKTYRIRTVRGCCESGMKPTSREELWCP